MLIVFVSKFRRTRDPCRRTRKRPGRAISCRSPSSQLLCLMVMRFCRGFFRSVCAPGLAIGVLGLAAVAFGAYAGSRAAGPVTLRLTSADYANAIQRTDGRVNVEAMAARLKELGVGTYYWLVEPAKDWEDLK